MIRKVLARPDYVARSQSGGDLSKSITFRSQRSLDSTASPWLFVEPSFVFCHHAGPLRPVAEAAIRPPSENALARVTPPFDH